MELINTTRRHYIFEDTGLPEGYKDSGVKVEEGLAYFPRIHADNSGRLQFLDEDACQKYVEKEKDEVDVKHVDAQFKSVEIKDADWELMQKQMTNPQMFKKEDFRTYKVFLANNFPDRDNERFTLSALKAFNKSIVGKGKLTGHQWGPPGDGRFYKSELEKMTSDEVEAFTSLPKRVTRILKKVEEVDGGIYYLAPSFYILSDDAATIRKMDAGIIRDMSIGFRVPVRQDYKDAEDNVLWKDLTTAKDDDGEAYEGSTVWLGCQFGAGIAQDQKSHGKTTEEETCDNSNDDIEGKVLDELKGNEMIEIKLPKLGLELKVEAEKPETIEAAVAAIEGKLQVTEDEAKKVRDELTGLKSVLGENVTKEEITKMLADASEYHEYLIGEIIKQAVLADMLENTKDKLEQKRTSLVGKSVDELKQLLKEVVDTYNEEFSPAEQTRKSKDEYTVDFQYREPII